MGKVGAKMGTLPYNVQVNSAEEQEFGCLKQKCVSKPDGWIFDCIVSLLQTN